MLLQSPLRRRCISIHAPRTGSDQYGSSPARVCLRISIHAPRTGSDVCHVVRQPATQYFNPRSPHGERPHPAIHGRHAGKISIHAPRTGSDINDIKAERDKYAISIHAPRTGSDRCRPATFPLPTYFNPRSPHGERLRKVTILSIRIIGFAQKVYHKTVLLRISLAENAVILPKRPRNPVRTSLQKAGGLRFARAIRAARPYSISSPSGA